MVGSSGLTAFVSPADNVLAVLNIVILSVRLVLICAYSSRPFLSNLRESFEGNLIMQENQPTGLLLA